MKDLNNWLSVKTELVIFESPTKILSEEITIKLSRKRVCPSNSVKYLDIGIDRFLHWHDQVNTIAVKFNGTNASLSKIRY